MDKLPRVIVSSVIRGTKKGESHGGIYIIDLDKEIVEPKIDWRELDIEWESSGRDRGLRGIAFYDEKIYIASSNEILIFNSNFSIIDRITNKYLGSCHEMYISLGKLYITSTYYDSIVIYDLKAQEFIRSYHICYINSFPNIIEFNPNEDNGPTKDNRYHINNVFVVSDEIYFSGLNCNVLFKISKGGKLSINQIIPTGTHNVQCFDDGILMNNTKKDIIVHKLDNITTSYNIKKYNEDEIISPQGDYFARQAFGRGLTTWKNYIIGGSSPSTISVYEKNNPKPIKTINITMDIRNSIHGLEIWPF